VKESFAGSLITLFEHDEHAVIGFGRAEAVNATDEATMITSRRSKSERVALMRNLSSLVVDGGFFFDVNVRGGDVGFRLMKS